MASYKNVGIKGYFQRYGYKNGILRGLFMANPLHFVKDYENRKILYYRKVERKLKRRYIASADKDPEGLEFAHVECRNPVWIYWKQGVEKAPDIIKACISSVKSNCGDEVHIITDQNIDQYVKFPVYIIKRLENGSMSVAAFSDLLRFSLLEHFGGTWIDATVYLTGNLPDYMTDCELFVFRDSYGLIRNPALMSNWFIHSSVGNKVMRQTRNMVFEYWKKEDHVIEYLFTYLLLTIALNNNTDIADKMPYANSEYTHLLLDELGNYYNEKKYEYITSLSSVHKLSYKLFDNVFDNKENFYHKLVEKYL